MSNWVSMEVGETASLVATGGTGRVLQFGTPCDTLLIGLETIPQSETRFLVAVGCHSIPQLVAFPFEQVTCCRQDEQTLHVEFEGSEQSVQCHAVRTGSADEMGNWGQLSSYDEEAVGDLP